MYTSCLDVTTPFESEACKDSKYGEITHYTMLKKVKIVSLYIILLLEVITAQVCLIKRFI